MIKQKIKGKLSKLHIGVMIFKSKEEHFSASFLLQSERNLRVELQSVPN